MSDSTGPKHETVRIALPPSAIATDPAAFIGPPRRVTPPPPPPSKRLPISLSPPVAHIPLPAASPAPAPPVTIAPPAPPSMPPRPRVLPPPPRIIPPSPVVKSASEAPQNYPSASVPSGPRKETARITILPEPAAPRRPTVKMAETQPLSAAPAAQIASAPVIAISTDARPPLDPVSLPICWAIFGLSAVALLIQIWNYFGA